MVKRQGRHLWVVPPPSGAEEDPEPQEPHDPEPQEPHDPEPPDDDFRVLLW